MLNQYKIVGDILIVYNRKDGREMLFDVEDFDLISKYTWHIDNYGYCISSIRNAKRLSAQRFLMNDPKDKHVDHINGDRKDNRKKNLRLVSQQQNNHNRLNVKGYYFNKVLNKWVAQIKLNNKSMHIGCYITEQEAHQAYLEAKKIYHPSAPHHLYK